MSAVGAEVIIFHGPPFSGRTLYYERHLAADYVRVDPEDIYRQEPAITIRQLINKYIITPLKQDKKVVIDESFQTVNKRESYLNLIRKKLPAVRCVCYSFTPEHGAAQLHWAQQYSLADLSTSHDDHLLELRARICVETWLNQAESPGENEGFSSISEIKCGLVAKTHFKLEVPVLFIQWEGMLQSRSDDPELVPGIQKAIQIWYTTNPCGRVIIIADGNSSLRVTNSERKHQFLSEFIKKVSDCPLYVMVVTPQATSDEFCVPPRPGILALLQKLHHLDLQHQGSMYLYHTATHTKMADQAGVRHIKAARVFGHPSLAGSSHAMTQANVPAPLRTLDIIPTTGTDTSTGSGQAVVPLYEELLGSDKCFVTQRIVMGKLLYAFVKGSDTLSRYQKDYSENATEASCGEPSRLLALSRHPSLTQTTGNALSTSTHNRSLLDQTGSDRSRDLPKWMGSGDKKEKTPLKRKSSSSMENSLSDSAVMSSFRADRSKTVYVLSADELVETAKLILLEAGESVPSEEDIQASLNHISDSEEEAEKAPPGRKYPKLQRPHVAVSDNIELESLSRQGRSRSRSEERCVEDDTASLHVSETDLSQVSRKASTRKPNVTISDSFVQDTSSAVSRVTKSPDSDNDDFLDELLFDNYKSSKPEKRKRSVKEAVVPDSFVSESGVRGSRNRSDLGSAGSCRTKVIADSLVPNTSSGSKASRTMEVEDILVPETSKRSRAHRTKFVVDSFVPDTGTIRSSRERGNTAGRRNASVVVVPDSFVPETVTTVPETVFSERDSNRDQSVNNRTTCPQRSHVSSNTGELPPEEDEFDILDGLI